MLLDQHGEGRNQHGVEFSGHALGKASIVRSNHTEFLVLNPLLESHHIFGHVPNLFDGAATFNLEGVEDILSLGADSLFVGDIVSDGPHLLPVELLGIDKHTVIEVGLVDIEVHHAGIGTANLCDIGVAETTAHLSSAAPVLNLSLNLRVATFYDTRNHSRTLTGTIQVGHHLTDGTAGIELAQPDGNVRLCVIGSQLLLHVYDDHRHIQVAHGRQHIIRGAIGQHLQDDEIHVGRTELIAGLHRLFLRGHHSTVDNLDGRGQCLLECCILSLKLRYELWELRQVCSECNGEHAHPCFGFN